MKFSSCILNLIIACWCLIANAENDGETPDNAVSNSDTVNIKNFKATDFYEGCDETKFCIGDVHACVNQMSCFSAMSFRKDEHKSEIELYARTGKYIALGISRDKYMGDDAVVECIREHNTVRVYRSWNLGRKNKRLEDQGSITLKGANYQDGWVYCKFLLNQIFDVKINTATHKFDLGKEKFHILLARGDETKTATKLDPDAVGIGYHGGGVSATKEKFGLLDYVGESTARIILEKIHGVICCLVWMILFPIATFFVRYFKETYHNKFIFFDFTVWYGMHVILICTVVGLTTLSMLLLLIGKLVDSQMRPPEWNAHSLCGIILLAIMYLQFGLGIFISKNKNPTYLWVHNLHCFIGQGITFLTFATIYTSRYVKHGLPCIIPATLITYGVLYMLIHLMMSYQVCYIDYVQGATSSRVYSITGLRPARVTDLEPEAPGGGFRKVILGLFVAVCSILTLVVIIMYLLDLEDCVTFNNHKRNLEEEDESGIL